MISLSLRFHFPTFSLLTILLIGPGCVRKHFFQTDARPDAARPLPASADSVRGATAGRHYARHSGLYHALVGRHHRRSWAAPVAAPVLRLTDVRPGGLRPSKIGGGFNSTSLTLTAPDGQAYVLRTVDKDPIRATPMWLRGTFLVNMLRDNVSSTQPFGSLVVPPLADAAGVPHANPRLYYVRADDANFQRDSLSVFRGQLAVLEEKSAVPLKAAGTTSVVNSTKAFAAIYDSPNQQLDQMALLRARLLDGWLGDWDRHEGQWNWAISPPAVGGTATVSPLPKDRDMVFYRLDDGMLGWLVGHVFLPHWVTFAPQFAHTSNLLSSGRYLDRRGLNELTRAQFQAVAKAMQQRLPDTLIARAVQRLPPAAFAIEGARTVAALRARRDALSKTADNFYQELARHPAIGGTAQAERFEIHRYADSTVVAVYPALSASTPQWVYRRAFFPSETKSIQLEGLGGDDLFVVEEHSPKPSSRPKITIYGGAGNDNLSAKTNSRGITFRQESAPAKEAFDKPPKE